MIRHVFKYPLNFSIESGNITEIQMPSNGFICDVNYQNDCIFLWDLIDIHAPLKTYRFVVEGTGWLINDAEKLEFIKTIHMPNGIVWHIFKVIE